MKSRFVLSGIIALLGSAGIVCGCSDVEEQQFAPATKSRISATIVADTDTRTSLVGGSKIEWETTDKIGVFTAGAIAQVPFTVEDIDGGSATFVSSYTIDTGASKFYAVFPYYDGTRMNGTGLKFELPATQTYRENGFASTANPMAAVSSEPKFKFRNLCGALQLDLTGFAVVREIVFTSEEGPAVSGEGLIDCTDPDAPVFTPDETAAKSVTLSCTAVALNDEATIPFYIVLPAGSYTKFSVTIKDTSGQEKSFEGRNLTIKRSVITRTELYCGDPDAVIDLNSPVYYGLAETDKPAYANCFIVSRPGNYHFDAADATGAELENTAKADWVWAIGENWDSANHQCSELMQNIEYDATANEIKFSVKEGYTKGNVLLAALDSNNRILWSWHIWITGSPKEITANGGGGKLLDRNLGATSSTPGTDASIGLLYQWGRKEPFPGAYGVGTDTAVAQEIKKSGNMPFTSGANPTTQYAGYTSYNLINDAVITKTWDGAYGSLSSEFSNVGAEQKYITDSAAAKFPTIFFHAASWMPNYENGTVADWTTYPTANPCPYGYVLPTREQIDAVLGTSYANCAFVSDAGIYGVNAGSAWLPCTGYRSGGTGENAGSLKNAGYTGRYWTASSATGTTGVWYYFEPSKSTMTIGDGSKLHGAAIRCIKKK